MDKSKRKTETSEKCIGAGTGVKLPTSERHSVIISIVSRSLNYGVRALLQYMREILASDLGSETTV